MSRNINNYFFEICKIVASRSTCPRKHVGCIITRDKSILSTGYNGSPRGLKHCDDIGCEIDDKGSCIRTTHSEQNAICQAAKNGVSIENSTMYVTMFPCYTCAKMIVNCGIKEIHALEDYHSSERSKKIFKEAKIKFKIYD